MEGSRGGDGEMGRWGDGEVGRWGGGEMGSVRGVRSSKPLTTNHCTDVPWHVCTTTNY
ncbi:hypothetical protein [Fischerella sp. FACHB-380]|uniref:hypothetical protein n=1 Tax=Fischerella sp. FACHB-380 TaxID=2692799 RepID=UPI0003075BDF|nr:hypothetical protein [Fischerella sp. FACHB-380]